ncbi:MAG: HDOD domain-containing protein [Nitrosomonas sp.]|nr:HDOD domain-containing protein [Nitrosomonas sp.]
MTDRHELAENLRLTLQQTDLIPPLPETARKLLELRNKPDANLDALVRIIENDPILAAFVMKYARMAIFGYGDRIRSVTHAVALVLGFATALNVALGIASSGCLKIPNYGRLGRVRLWGDALQCAQLCRELSRHVAEKSIVNSGLAYLGGLLQDFGYLLFAHFCPKEFAILNDLVTQDQGQDIRALEIKHFGITHDLLGFHLLKAWNLPEEVILIAAKHHFSSSAGKHVLYVKLIVTANRLLRKDDSLEAHDQAEISALLFDLGIDEREAEAELQKIRQYRSEFSQVARELAA